MDEQKNILVIFTEKSDQLLSSIMAKYQLEENYEKILQNIKEKKPDNSTILTDLITNFVKGKISDKILTDSIQSNIGVMAQMANEITKEIILNVVPTVKKMTEEDINKLNEENINRANEIKNAGGKNIMTKIKAPIEVEKILQQSQENSLKDKIKSAPEDNFKKPMPSPVKKYSSAKKSAPIREPEKKDLGVKPAKPDPYKESIE